MTVKTAIAATCSTVFPDVPPIIVPATAQIVRFFGFNAESTTPKPAALTRDKESSAFIQRGRVVTAGDLARRNHPRIPRSSRSRPNHKRIQSVADGDVSERASTPDVEVARVNTVVTPAIPAVQPSKNPSPVSVERRARSINNVAMTGTGLSATATANGNGSTTNPPTPSTTTAARRAR
ncbi:hypothetical protein OG558_03740 [Kribbella sp. NBC_01510]